MQALSAALDAWRIALLPDPALYESAAQAVIAKPAAAIKVIRMAFVIWVVSTVGKNIFDPERIAIGLPPVTRPTGERLTRRLGGIATRLNRNRPAGQSRGGESK